MQKLIYLSLPTWWGGPQEMLNAAPDLYSGYLWVLKPVRCLYSTKFMQIKLVPCIRAALSVENYQLVAVCNAADL